MNNKDFHCVQWQNFCPKCNYQCKMCKELIENKTDEWTNNKGEDVVN